ncbi:2-C-methyl-D-erythritol 4-phosphate cytidylyltransferase [Arenicella chitinivorans]|uniref:2-C-methyl-D-erythritol 4-phosphate cytidylyltransferase n=1 Tax=Arenicella chitinivorans TaxID=1329800 RepID=A0A918VLW0_9GAMM|nr:2-C-methyl-D-erythritol 4-phosphate cytidylyltransferase [Arenicella chitinivorans]GHA07900.1 2-C-methyl-D-erythritol 4-phosphate cytidylyltransferase [Arenicella chitinivorans]
MARYWCVVPAAGIGSRMQSVVPKQYLRINDRTVIEHALTPFLIANDIDGVVVAVSPGDATWPQVEHSLNTQGMRKLITTQGGLTRAQSVLNGLAALQARAADDDWVLVHDAARPCFGAQDLRHLMVQVANHAVGGIVAIRAKDTLKQAEERADRIAATIDRTQVWQAQTPQMFRFGLLYRSLQAALAAKVSVTDESSAVEWAGYAPLLVEGDARNLKVTTPEDLALARFWLSNAEVNS